MTFESGALLMGLLGLGGQGPVTVLHPGTSPQLAIDSRGIVRLVFGRRDTVFAATSTDQGLTFTKPVIVAIVPSLGLGNTRGPVIASSRNRTMVATVTNGGDINLFRLEHSGGDWKPVAQTLNSAPRSAPEGLMTLAADNADNFHAVWLDLRLEKTNQIFHSKITTTSSTATWTPNTRINIAPVGSACECCRPSVAVANGKVAVMFRNNLDGFRDMYLTTSSDGGRTFPEAKKLGTGTWKLNACPMDGGALAIDNSGQVATVWRREATVYSAKPGDSERPVADGRSPMLSQGPKETYLIWQELDQIKLGTLGSSATVVVGQGRLPQVLALPKGGAVTAWEKDGVVYYRKM